MARTVDGQELRCRKCGSANIKTKYTRMMMRYGMTPRGHAVAREEECLAHTCKACGFWWHTRCRDEDAAPME